MAVDGVDSCFYKTIKIIHERMGIRMDMTGMVIIFMLL